MVDFGTRGADVTFRGSFGGNNLRVTVSQPEHEALLAVEQAARSWAVEDDIAANRGDNDDALVEAGNTLKDRLAALDAVRGKKEATP